MYGCILFTSCIFSGVQWTESSFKSLLCLKPLASICTGRVCFCCTRFYIETKLYKSLQTFVQLVVETKGQGRRTKDEGRMTKESGKGDLIPRRFPKGCGYSQFCGSTRDRKLFCSLQTNSNYFYIVKSG